MRTTALVAALCIALVTGVAAQCDTSTTCSSCIAQGSCGSLWRVASVLLARDLLTAAGVQAGAKAHVFRGPATVLTTVLARRLTTTGTGRRARQCRSASSKPLAATASRNPTAVRSLRARCFAAPCSCGSTWWARQGGAMGNALMERMPARTMKSARQAMGTGTGDRAPAPLGALSTTNAAPAPLTTTAVRLRGAPTGTWRWHGT